MRSSRARFDRDEDYTFGIFDPHESSVLGACGLHKRLGEGSFEIGYWIHQHHIRQGLGSEAVAGLLRAAFEIYRVERVEIHCDPENSASAAIPRKLLFTHEVTLPDRRQLPDGSWGDTMIWTLFAEQYPSSPAASARVNAMDAGGKPLLRASKNA